MNHTKYVRLSDGSIGSVLLLKPGCPPLGALQRPPARRRQDWRRSQARQWITWTRSGRWNRQGRRYYGCRRAGSRRGARRRSRQAAAPRAVIRLAAHGAHGSRSGRSPDHGLVSLDPRLSPQAGRGPHRRLRARHGAGRRLCRQRRRGCAFERRALPAGGLVHRRAALAAARRHRRACRQQAAGAAVFRNPRLSPQAQHAAYLDARAALLPALRRRALLVAGQVRHADRQSACEGRAAAA